MAEPESFVGCHLKIHTGPYVTVANDQFMMVPTSYDYNASGHLVIRLKRRNIFLHKTSDDNFTDEEAAMDAFQAMEYYHDGRAELLEDFVSGELLYSFEIPPLLQCIPLYRRVFFMEIVSSLGIRGEIYGNLREMLVNKFETYSASLLDRDIGQLSMVAELFILIVDFVDPSDLWLFRHIDIHEDAMSSADNRSDCCTDGQDDGMSTTDSLGM